MRALVVGLGIVCIGLLVLCLFLMYGVLDQAISTDHARREQQWLREDRDLLRDLARDLTRGIKRDKVENLLASKYSANHIVKKEGPDTVFVDEVGFYFRGDELVDIVFMNESDPNRVPGQSD